MCKILAKFLKSGSEKMEQNSLKKMNEVIVNFWSLVLHRCLKLM